MKVKRWLLPVCALAWCSVTAFLNTASAQEAVGDPTLPSAKIKQRLTQPVPITKETIPAEQAEAALPSIVLKAIVLTDRDHGSAIIESAGRKFVVPLSRDSMQRLNGFSVGGVLMLIEDFTASSLLIRCGKQSLLLR